MYPRKLTIKQEENIINKLLRDGVAHIGYGSSRVVFPYGKDKVIKIALTREGFNQNKAELNTYTNCDRENTLADVFCYGNIMLISEKCELVVDADSGEYENYLSDLYDNGENDVAQTLEETISYLEENLGVTDDNFQLGRNRKGFIVSLDYGFVPDSEDEQVGNMDEITFSNSDKEILNLALTILRLSYKGKTFNSEELDSRLHGLEAKPRKLRHIVNNPNKPVTVLNLGCEVDEDGNINFKLA